jgi:hypothetical protein
VFKKPAIRRYGSIYTAHSFPLRHHFIGTSSFTSVSLDFSLLCSFHQTSLSTYISHSSHCHYMFHSSQPWFILLTVQGKVSHWGDLIFKSFLTCLLGVKFLSTFEHPQRVKPHILHPHKAAGTTTILYILSSDFKERLSGRCAEG